MTRGFSFVALALSLLGSARACLCDLCAPLGVVVPTLPEGSHVPRRDLLAGRMPTQAPPTARRVRPQRDQRPVLRMFTLPRNDFAY